MKHTLILYSSTLFVLVALDMAWLGNIARNFYASRLGDLLEIQTLPAVLFYLMYTAGILLFVSNTENATLKSVLLYSALLGLFAYATYDLTNLATLKVWSWPLAIVDIAWGIVATTVAATAGWWVANYFKG